MFVGFAAKCQSMRRLTLIKRGKVQKANGSAR
jgi:hypothetical protein